MTCVDDPPEHVSPGFAHIPIKDLPQELTQQIHAEIRARSVSLLVTDQDDDRDASTSAATLVRFGGRPYLLTARHVWEYARGWDVLGIALNDRMLRIQTSDLNAIVPGVTGRLPELLAKVPDIALICLSASHQATIEARGRAFYSIEKRQQFPPQELYSDLGFLVVTGSPHEKIDFQQARIPSLLYDTNASHTIEHEGWDYIFVNLDIEANPDIPKDFRGTSGGGLWRVKYRVSPGRDKFWLEDPGRDIVLCGVNFMQTAKSGRQLVAHGPRSIYERIFNDIARAS